MSEDYTYETEPTRAHPMQVAALRDANARLAARVMKLERENEVLRMIIDVIDIRTPVADETCDEPGICVSEAARRVLADEGKIDYDYKKAVQP